MRRAGSVIRSRRPEVRAVGDREPRRTRPVKSKHGHDSARAALRPLRDDDEKPRKQHRSPKRHAAEAERLGEPELARREKRRRRFRRKRS